MGQAVHPLDPGPGLTISSGFFTSPYPTQPQLPATHTQAAIPSPPAGVCPARVHLPASHTRDRTPSRMQRPGHYHPLLFMPGPCSRAPTRPPPHPTVCCPCTCWCPYPDSPIQAPWPLLCSYHDQHWVPHLWTYHAAWDMGPSHFTPPYLLPQAPPTPVHRHLPLDCLPRPPPHGTSSSGQGPGCLQHDTSPAPRPFPLPRTFCHYISRRTGAPQQRIAACHLLPKDLVVRARVI